MLYVQYWRYSDVYISSSSTWNKMGPGQSLLWYQINHEFLSFRVEKAEIWETRNQSGLSICIQVTINIAALFFVLKPVIWWARILCGKLSGQLRAAFMINLWVKLCCEWLWYKPLLFLEAMWIPLYTCFCIKHLLLHMVITCLLFEITEIKLTLQAQQIVEFQWLDM